MKIIQRILVSAAPLLLAAVVFGVIPAPVAHAQDTPASGASGAALAAPAPAVTASEAPGMLPPAATSKGTVDNPYGLGALWAQGDFV